MIRGSGVESFQRDDGSYAVLCGPPPADPAAKRRLTITTEEFGSEAAEIPRDLRGPLTVRFEAIAELDVVVAGYAGSGLEGAIEIEVVPAESDRSDGRHVVRAWGGRDSALGADGKLSLRTLKPGPYELLVKVVGAERYQSLVAERVPLDLRSGPNEISVGVPVVYPLTILVDGTGSLMLSSSKESRRSTGGMVHRGLDGSGKVVFERVPPGTYTVQRHAPGSIGPEIMTVSVASPTEVRFAPSPADCLVISVHDPAGYFAKAGLATGDRLIGIDGVEFQSMEQMIVAVLSATSKPEVRFKVLREGRTFEVAVDPKRIMNPMEAGAGLEPGSRK